MVVCGIKCVNLNNEIMKILGVYFSNNNNLEHEKFLQTQCQNRKHCKIMVHDAVDFRKKNYGLQILSYF